MHSGGGADHVLSGRHVVTIGFQTARANPALQLYVTLIPIVHNRMFRGK